MSIKISGKMSIFGENCHILCRGRRFYPKKHDFLFICHSFLGGKRDIKKAGYLPSYVMLYEKRSFICRLSVLADGLFVFLSL